MEQEDLGHQGTMDQDKKNVARDIALEQRGRNQVATTRKLKTRRGGHDLTSINKRGKHLGF